MGRNKKRKHSQFAQDGEAEQQDIKQDGSIGATLAKLRTPAPSEKSHDRDSAKRKTEDGDEEEWTVVGKNGKKRKTNNYPTLSYADLHQINSIIKINDLQRLVLYCIANGPSPQWLSVRHHFGVKKAVVLFVPGLERGMFNGDVALYATESIGQDTEPNNGAASPAEEALVEPVSSGIAVPQTNGVSHNGTSPDDYVPVRLSAEDLPQPLKPLAECFEHLWPVKAPGDNRFSKVFSPLHAMLNVNSSKSQESRTEKKPKGAKAVNGQDWENKPTRITSYILSKDDLQENDYVIHPAWFSAEAQRAAEVKRRAASKQTAEDGWVDSKASPLDIEKTLGQDVPGDLTAGCNVLAMDCEMCTVEGGDSALTRISLVGWDRSVVMDELVKPDKLIIDYLTRFSGMTADMLNPVTTTLPDIQKRLLDILTPTTILIGHSLDSDLTALKLTHPFIIDTSVLYQHPRGPPLKSSLKWLAQKYLSREIQKGHGTLGHDSVEDSRACLDLVKQKCEKGPEWGNSGSDGETIFKRLARTPPFGKGALGEGEQGKTGAIVDHGAPEKNFGQMATFSIACDTDADVVDGVRRAVHGDPYGAVIPGGGVDFTWARMRDLETFRGWRNNHRYDLIQMENENPPDSQPNPNKKNSNLKPSQASAVAATITHIKDLHTSLPPCTLLIVYTGTGDPRPLARLQHMQRTFRTEYKTKKWDELSVKWTDVEEQAMKQACVKAREGLGFMCVT